MTSRVHRTAIALLVAACSVGDDTDDAGPESCRPKRVLTDEIVACTQNAECRIDTIHVDCHDGCGGIHRGNVLAVRSDHEWGEERPCTCGIICLGSPPDPSLLAGCQDARCGVLDVQAQGWADCSSDADCTLLSIGCCPPAAVIHEYGELIPVNRGYALALSSFICEGPPRDCPPTVEEPTAAVCAEGHCQTGSRRP